MLDSQNKIAGPLITGISNWIHGRTKLSVFQGRLNDQQELLETWSLNIISFNTVGLQFLTGETYPQKEAIKFF